MHRFASRGSPALSFVAALALAGCPETNLATDTGAPGLEAGPAPDAAVVQVDAPAPILDAPPAILDAALPSDDAPVSTADAPVVADDAWSAPPDAFVLEACPTAGASETVPCGLCGTRLRFCTSARVWEYDTCVQPADAVCEPGTSDTIACGSLCGTQPARCDAMCHWMPSGMCTEVGECVPGTRRRSTMGCAVGEFRETTCDAACMLGAPGPCMAYRPEVDILLLVDNTGSHTSLVMSNATILATELVGGLLADADVRVGVASFADFPRGSYGSAPDEPFRGLLQPTSDMAMISSSLSAVASRGGGDLPESGVEALHVAAGGPAHPDSFPFTCGAGLEPGGCWRASSQRAVVMLTDITQHGIPSPAFGGAAISPYTGFTPAPPTWMAARDQLVSSGVAFFAIVPMPGGFGGPEGDAPAQMRFIATELAQDPDASVVVYPAGTTNLTASAREMVTHLRAYFGLTP